MSCSILPFIHYATLTLPLVPSAGTCTKKASARACRCRKNSCGTEHRSVRQQRTAEQCSEVAATPAALFSPCSVRLLHTAYESTHTRSHPHVIGARQQALEVGGAQHDADRRDLVHCAAKKVGIRMKSLCAAAGRDSVRKCNLSHSARCQTLAAALSTCSLPMHRPIMQSASCTGQKAQFSAAETAAPAVHDKHGWSGTAV